MPIYQYRCKCGKEFDKILTRRQLKWHCECGKVADIQVSPHAKTPSAWVV